MGCSMNDKEKTINIGKDKNNSSINWAFFHEKLANTHMFMTGSSGEGKTYALKHLLIQAMKSGISSIVFDYGAGFIDETDSFYDIAKYNIDKRNIYSDGIPINIFARQYIETYNSNEIEKIATTAKRVADIFENVYGLGSQQGPSIYRACKKMLESDDNNELISLDINQNISLETLLCFLASDSSTISKSVIDKISPLVDSNFFKPDMQFNWGDIIYAKDKITIFDFSIIPDNMQSFITEIILWDLWYYTEKHGDTSNPFVVVLDECQNLNYKTSSPTSKILKEGRKFGWSAWFSTQDTDDGKLKNAITRLQQAALRIYFKPTINEIPSVSKNIDRRNHKDWIQLLKYLNKGECVVCTNLEDSPGKLSYETVITKIPPISGDEY